MEKNLINSRLKSLTREKALDLGKQFVDELTKEFGIRFIYWFDGSIATKKYVAGKSDIDLVVIPDESCNYGDVALKIWELMEKYANDYGKVYKNGRWVSIIDAMIFLNVNVLLKWNAFYHEILEPALEENKCLDRIKIDIKKVKKFEEKWQKSGNQNTIQKISR